MVEWLLRGETCSLSVNVVDFRFDGERRSCCRSRGTLTVELPAACDREVLAEIVRSRAAVVLERQRSSAIEMRLTREVPTYQTIPVPAATFEWATP
jgi:hypothetical protein